MLYRFVKFVFRIYFSIFNRVTVKGFENIPEYGGIIICSNHINWLDPILLGAYLKRKINFMAKAELFRNKLFAVIMKGINAFPVKRGEADITAIKTSLRIIKNNEVLGIFPEGTRSKDGKLRPAEPGVALIGVRTKAPVIPVGISGRYNIFNKLNIIVGNPMIFEGNGSSKLTNEDINNLSQSIMYEIGKLLKQGDYN
jgi:1-acyl-sn-glycerol-3-phosphate acyltransferase